MSAVFFSASTNTGSHRPPLQFAASPLEAEEVRQLYDECTLPDALSGRARDRVPRVIVNNVEIAQRVVQDIEADIRAHLMRVRIILNVRIEECARTEPVNEP